MADRGNEISDKIGNNSACVSVWQWVLGSSYRM